MLKKITFIIPPFYKRRSILIMFFLFLSMILEALGLGMVLPVTKIILDPEIINRYPLIFEFFSEYGIEQHSQIITFVMISFAIIYAIKTVFLTVISWFVADYSQGLSASISNKIFK